MRRSLTIGMKIWVSLSILILGYFATMFVGFVLGEKNEANLLTASESLFPASVSSQNALAAFREEIKLYNDAVLTGDTEVLEDARNKSSELTEALSSIVTLEGIGAVQKSEIEKTLNQYKSFHTSAQNVYLRFANEQSDDNVTQAAIQLGKQTPLIEQELIDLTSATAQDLKNALQDISNSTKRLRYTNLFVFLLVVLGATLVTSIIIRRSISKPIKDTVLMIKDMAKGGGDLTRRLQIKSNDEIGEQAQWFNLFLEKQQAMIRNIVGNAETLNKASSKLSNLSSRMSEGADQMSAKTNSVATASEEMSVNMDSVAAAMEEASTNISMVATSAEEMTATIDEIAQNSERARTITGESVDKGYGVSVRVNELGRAAQEIGKVTEAISEISEQTNLLALNATIEAARAGEAGKGFAVVANEIKELARQTAEATQEIKGQIEGIQNSATGTVTEIEKILKVINDVNEIVSAIATAVEEQSVTTKEIAENVSQGSHAIQEVNKNVSESSAVSRDIAIEITEVNQSSVEMANSSAQVNLSAGELKNLAEQLNGMVNKFKV